MSKQLGLSGKKFEDFIKIVKELRQKCPWDREQTIESIRPYMIEEVYEAIQAIDEKKYKHLAEELGDMLLHIVMLSVFAAETNKFNINDVLTSISEKMVRRHPHVFGGKIAKTKEQVWLKWEKIKQKEAKSKGVGGKEQGGMLEGIPRHLPALYRAEKVQKRAARVGFDWDQVAGAWKKVHEELEEVHELLNSKIKIQNSKKAKNLQKIKEELGDLLFSIVNVTRKLGIDAEETLQQANSKFMRRFSKIEKALLKKKMTVEQMDQLWDKIKKTEPR